MDNIKKFEGFLDRMQGLLDNAKEQGHILVRVEDLENAFPELKESKDERKPNGGIVMEDFNEGDGFYKVNLAYLNKKQVEEIEKFVEKWNETEDEGIRKDIINYFQCQSRDEPTRKDIHNKWIAWLEKQGEQAKIAALRTEYEKGRADAIAELQQKPFDYSNANIQQKDYAEQKPAEEYNIRGIGSKHAEGKLKELIDKLDAEKKELKNIEQKPVELSSKDILIKEEIINVLQKNGKCEEISWLKSLSPQNKWKPSEEQIRYLQSVVNEPKNAGAESCHNALAKLLGQLKTL